MDEYQLGKAIGNIVVGIMALIIAWQMYKKYYGKNKKKM
jgi:hypothetical protein